MPLTLHRSARVDLLVDTLAARLALPQDDPFAPELIVVPAKGVERWLSQRLSHVLGSVNGDGVAANIEFRSQRSLVAQVVGAADNDPWRPEALVWPLLEVIDASMGQPWCRDLTRHLGRDDQPHDTQRPDTHTRRDRRRGRRWAVGNRIAVRFAAYAAGRPAMMRAWEAGHDTDGTGAPLDDDLKWQAELWRRLAAHLAVATPGVRLDAAVQQVRDDPGSLDLPSRLAWFGPTRIPAADVHVINALAHGRDVDVLLPHPSDSLWQALRETSQEGVVPRGTDTSRDAVRHPLLATLGRDLRELQRTVGEVVSASVAVDAPTPRPATLLGRLQDDIEANREPVPFDLAADDRSVQVHACHGAARQVEVLREVIVGLLADDPTLEPRDIVVMCPDIEQYAPLVEAAFGMGGLAESDQWHPGQQLQVRLADRSLMHTNPLLAVLDRVLNLADGRAEASALLDLAACDPVRRRFNFTDDDLETVARWVDRTGIRWAFDAEHRAPFGLSSYVQNTWQFGLDRLLTGVAVSDDAQRYFDSTLPFDDIGSGDINLVGRLAEFVDRLRSVTDQLSGTRPVSEWVETLRNGLSSLTAVEWGEEWQQHQAERELSAMADHRSAAELVLRLTDVRALVNERLVGRPTRANFRTGSLTVCTMVPMRSVPHRVVCLVGIDDGSFPRSTSIDGDDILTRRPLTGERDLRSEDRQLMLDALMAATETFVVTYTGANEVSGRRCPPAVPLGELLDTVDLMVSGGRDRVRVKHPLQAFDARNYLPSELGRTESFSFDRAGCSAAESARADRAVTGPKFDVQLPVVPADVDLADLGKFLRAPVKEFLRRSVGLNIYENDDEIRDAIPVELDSLQQWSVGDRLLNDELRGASQAEALGFEWRRGALPPGRMGWTMAQRISAQVAPVAARARSVIADAQATSVDLDLDLGNGRRLRGTVPGVYRDRVITVSYSSLGARHYLDAWVPLLALSVAQPEIQWTAGTVARHRDGSQLVVFDAIDPDTARKHLNDLVALHDLGLQQPLRLPLKTSFKLVTRGEAGKFGAGAQWRSFDRGWPGENQADLNPLVWGENAAFAALRDAPPELTIDTLAERLWRPILDRVVLS